MDGEKNERMKDELRQQTRDESATQPMDDGSLSFVIMWFSIAWPSK